MVLICYDGSPSAKRAISVAHAIVGHGPATVLYVWQAPRHFFERYSLGGSSAAAGPSIAALDALATERADVVADEGLELARRAGFFAEGRAEVSVISVWRTILDVADELAAELIVVGERGLSTVQSVLIGSVANGVVHHSKLPVLVVPRADATHDPRGAS